MPLTKDGHLYSGYEVDNLSEEQREYIKETNRRFREYHSKLLTEFIDFLNKCYYPIGNGEIMRMHINQFLDERSKNND